MDSTGRTFALSDVQRSIEWENLVVEAQDPPRLARWWAEALGYQISYEQRDEVRIGPVPGQHPGILFRLAPEIRLGPETRLGSKTEQASNRIHLDLRPADPEAEVERLVNMGARHVDIGRDGEHWVVLADPEGNEFHVLSHPVRAAAGA